MSVLILGALAALLLLSGKKQTVVKTGGGSDTPPVSDKPKPKTLTEEVDAAANTATGIVKGAGAVLGVGTAAYTALGGGSATAATTGSVAAGGSTAASTANTAAVTTGSASVGLFAGAIIAVVVYVTVILVLGRDALFGDIQTAKNSYDSDWFKTYAKIYNELLSKGGMTADEMVFISYPFTDGYMLELNRQRLRHQVAYKDPLMSVDAAAGAGANTGLYLGTPAPGGFDFSSGPVVESLTDTQYQAIAYKLMPDSLMRPGTAGPNTGKVQREAIINRMLSIGQLTANIGGYVSWMSKPHGVGVDDAGHALYGLKNNEFQGTVNYDGTLNTTVLSDSGAIVQGTVNSKGQITSAVSPSPYKITIKQQSLLRGG